MRCGKVGNGQPAIDNQLNAEQNVQKVVAPIGLTDGQQRPRPFAMLRSLVKNSIEPPIAGSTPKYVLIKKRAKKDVKYIMVMGPRDPNPHPTLSDVVN